MAGMSLDLGRDISGSEELKARKLRANLSFPILYAFRLRRYRAVAGKPLSGINARKLL